MLNYILGTIICSFIGYMIGSISWSLVISKLFYKKDVRDFYSKNAGATNTSRVLGTKIGMLVMILDIMKICISMFIFVLISKIHINNINFNKISYFIPVIFILIGHCWPIYFKFKGGKCVSTFIGLTFMFNPLYFVIWSVVWWGLFFIFSRVSLSSIIATIILMILCWIPQLSDLTNILYNKAFLMKNNRFIWFNQFHESNKLENLVIINTIVWISGILLIFRHKKNIIRLLKKQESKFSFFNNKKIIK